MKTLGWIILAVLAIVVGGLGFIYFSDEYDIYFVLTDSMKPALSSGDLIVTGPVNGPLTGEIRPEMIITFEQRKAKTTHRIISVDRQTKTLVTKGDANEEADSQPVKMSEVKGCYLFHIPYVGYVTNFTQTKNGWFLSIIAPAMLLVLFLIKDIIKEALSNPAEPGSAQEEVVAKMLAKYRDM